MKIPFHSALQKRWISPAKSKSESPGTGSPPAAAETADLSPGLLRVDPVTTFRKIKVTARPLVQAGLNVMLPALALLSGGAVGWVAALGANTALNYFLSPKGKHDLVGSFAAAAIGGVISTAALLGPTGLAAAGALALASGAKQARLSLKKLSPELEIDHQMMATQMSRAVNQNLEKITDARIDTPQRSPGMSKSAWEKLCSTSILKSFDLAAQHLGLTGALALTTDVMRGLMTESDARRLNHLTPIQATSQEPLIAQEAEHPTTLIRSFSQHGPAFASGTRVVLDNRLLRDKSPATLDFLVGHELSHLNHRDQALDLAKGVVLQTLQNAGNFPSRCWTVEQLDLTTSELSRQQEKRADRDGVLYALRRGHSPNEISLGARSVLNDPDDNSPLAEHPPNSVRNYCITYFANHPMGG